MVIGGKRKYRCLFCHVNNGPEGSSASGTHTCIYVSMAVDGSMATSPPRRGSCRIIPDFVYRSSRLDYGTSAPKLVRIHVSSTGRG